MGCFEAAAHIRAGSACLPAYIDVVSVRFGNAVGFTFGIEQKRLNTSGNLICCFSSLFFFLWY